MYELENQEILLYSLAPPVMSNIICSFSVLSASRVTITSQLWKI